MAEKKLKPGWRRVKFGDVVRLRKERCPDPKEKGVDRYVGLEHIDSDDLKIRRWGNVTDGITFTSVFREGQVLFGKRRAYQRKVALADFSGVCSGDIYVLESAKPAELWPALLPFICQTESFFKHAVGTSAGSLSPRTNWTSLARFEFALPPLNEQQRIVAALTEVVGQLESLDALFRAAENTRKAYLRETFLRLYGEKKRLGEVAEIRNGTTPQRARPEYWNGSIPWLPTGKVNERVIKHADEFITETALRQTSLRPVPADSTLVAMVGEGQTRGRAALLAIESCINQNFAAVIPGPGIDSRYLFYFLEHNYDALRGWSQGTNHHALSCGLLKQFPILVAPLDVQKRISCVLSSLDQVGQAAIGRKRQAKALKDALACSFADA